MEFETLHNFVSSKGKVTKSAERITDIVLDNLENPPGPVVLISGELHPGAYNDNEIGEILYQLNKTEKQEVCICWGPTTFFALNGARLNKLYTEGIEKSIGAPRFNIHHSQYRQDCHMWLFGDSITFQPPHRPGAGASEKETYWCKNATGVGKLIEQNLEQQMQDDDTLFVDGDEIRLDVYRTLDVILNEDNGVEKFVNPSELIEPIKYFSSLVPSIPEVAAVRYSVAEGSSNSVINISIFVTDEDRSFSISEKVIDYSIWTMDRYPEHTFDFNVQRVREDRLKGLIEGEQISYLRKS